MINISKVSDWLTQNVNDQLYPRLFLMSPNGTLLAYSKPVDIKELRDQAALISIVWKDNCIGTETLDSQARTIQDQAPKRSLRTLTVETESCNIIVRLLQAELLLILVGRIPPKKQQQFRITAEKSGDKRYPDKHGAGLQNNLNAKLHSSNTLLSSNTSPYEEGLIVKTKTPSLYSNLSQREQDIRVGALHIQRKKLDALADYVLKDFEGTGFVMPADSDLQ